MGTVDLRYGVDVLDGLRALPENSVHCVVTSPPYWGLRDYGTGQWEGGDPECGHKVGNQVMDNKAPGAITSGVRPGVDGSVCPSCGARRVDSQIGLEPIPDCLGWATGQECGACFVCHLVAVFREVKRVLRDDGVCFLNLGDSYNGSGGAGGDYGPNGLKAGQPKYPGRKVGMLKPKDLCMIPARVALALQADGWYLRQDIIWAKRAPMPESVTDRLTKSHEYVWLLAKSPRYYWDAVAVAESLSDSTLSDGRFLRNGNEETPYGDNISRASGLGRGPRTNGTGTRNRRDVLMLGPDPFSGWTKTVRRHRVQADAASDDTLCKVSPDCPVHGGLARQATTGQYDVRVGELWLRMNDNDTHPVQGLVSDSGSTVQPHGAASAAENSDSLHPGYALSATDHSTQNHRTGRVPVTSPAYTASAQTADRTGDTSESPALFDSVGRTPANNTGVDGSDDGLSVQTVSRIGGMYSSLFPPECTCELYHEVQESTSHFATMPRELAQICILAGTSAAGCCPACQAPYVRVVEKGEPNKTTTRGLQAWTAVTKQQDSAGGLPFRETISLGWRPSCTCHGHFESIPANKQFDADGETFVSATTPPTRVYVPDGPQPDPIPATVLDPFSGSGTTAAVAKSCGRSAIGIDLNPAYLPLAEDRIAAVTAPLVPLGYEDPAPQPEPANGYHHTQEALFA